MVSSFYPHNMCQSSEDYDKNWMHFVYKLDHLFQSKRVSDENSSVSKAFHFSKLISTQYFCLHSTCTIQSHILKFQTFLTSFSSNIQSHSCVQTGQLKE